MFKKAYLPYYLFILGTLIVYILGMPIDIMDIDAAQYASISREMLATKSFLVVHERGLDYLDKPPLLFWLSSLSYAIFGVHNWSYKLPSVLFACLGIYSTFKFAKLYYSEKTALMSAAILATTQALFLTTNDVRTDTILYSTVIFSTWHLAAYLQKRNLTHFLLAFLGIGLALLGKGPIGLIVPVLAFSSDWILKRQFLYFFKWEWIVGVLVIGVVLTPMCIGLYQQFGTEGLYFYFWKQSFGRITGESEWKSNGGYFFMFHSFLWSFLPWALFALLGIFSGVIKLFQQKFKLDSNQEFISLGGALLAYLALSQSKYQLPHYTYVFFPYIAVVTGSFLTNQWEKQRDNLIFKFVGYFQYVVVLALWIVGGLLTFVCFGGGIALGFLFMVLMGLSIYLLIRQQTLEKILFASFCTAIGVNSFMNLHIYPSLLSYQPSTSIAQEIKKRNIETSDVMAHQVGCLSSLDFYTQSTIKEMKDASTLDSLQPQKNYYLYTNKAGWDACKAKNLQTEVLFEAEKYHITKVTIHFLKPSTRPEKVEKVFLLRVRKEK